MARENARRATANAGEDARFEFARKHVIKGDRLRDRKIKAEKDLWNWLHADQFGSAKFDMFNQIVTRKPRTPEEREDLKALEAAVVDAETILLLHENDGRKL